MAKEASHTRRPGAARAWQGNWIKKACCRTGKGPSWSYMQIYLLADRSEGSLIEKNSTKMKLESMYLSISFCLDISYLASLMCHNRLGCLGYKYVPSSICKSFVTRPINKPYFLLAIYFSVSGFAIFFFCEFFRVDQGRLTFERLVLLVSFRLPNKSEL